MVVGTATTKCLDWKAPTVFKGVFARLGASGLHFGLMKIVEVSNCRDGCPNQTFLHRRSSAQLGQGMQSKAWQKG
jgi:hypothetical protein